MIKKAILALLALIAVFLGYVAMQPANAPITRSATLAAPAAVIFPHINDLHKWQAWSPWAKLDPNAKATFEGPDAGVGAAFSWAGNNDVGEGKMTIVESQPNDHVKFKLDFGKPFAGTSYAVLSLKPEGDKTTVTWSMTGENPSFLARVMCTLFNGNKMVGDMFDKGLANLGGVAKGA
jgi:hypothetical protein